MYRAYWQYTHHYDSPACFSCSIVSFEGSGLFSCISVFFSFDLSNFLISAILGLSDMVVEEAKRGDQAGEVGSAQWSPPSANQDNMKPCYKWRYILFVFSKSNKVWWKKNKTEIWLKNLKSKNQLSLLSGCSQFNMAEQFYIFIEVVSSKMKNILIN